jgi:hypothetical protein
MNAGCLANGAPEVGVVVLDEQVAAEQRDDDEVLEGRQDAIAALNGAERQEGAIAVSQEV